MAPAKRPETGEAKRDTSGGLLFLREDGEKSSKNLPHSHNNVTNQP